MATTYYGWDIGGAHLKVAALDEKGAFLAVRQVASPLWRGVNELSRACALLEFDLRDSDAVHAVTMTGELCDVFANRADGVRSILDELVSCLGTDAKVRVYGGYDGWLTLEQAGGRYAIAVASANWLALAAFTAELIGDGILIDVGSTTTDIIPIVNGEVQCAGRDDASRLACEELVYTGVVRTPVMAICRAVPFRGHWQNLAAEVFATTADVYRLLGEITDRHDLMPTADGRPKDLDGSARRLARMLGRDQQEDALAEMGEVAAFVARAQCDLIARSVDRVVSRDPGRAHAATLVGAGVGRFLVERIARARDIRYRSFDALIGADPRIAEDVVMAAPAVAVGKLAWMTE